MTAHQDDREQHPDGAPVPRLCWQMAVAAAALAATVLTLSLANGRLLLLENVLGAVLTAVVAFLVVSGVLRGSRVAVAAAIACYLALGIGGAAAIFSGDLLAGAVGLLGVAVAVHGLYALDVLSGRGWLAARARGPEPLHRGGELLVLAVAAASVSALLVPPPGTPAGPDRDQRSAALAAERISVVLSRSARGDRLPVVPLRDAAARDPRVRLGGVTDANGDGTDDDGAVLVRVGSGAACLRAVTDGRAEVTDAALGCGAR